MFLVIYCICDKLNFWKILKNNKVRAIWKLTRKTNSTLEQISGHEFLLGQLVWYIRSYFPASFVTPSQTTEGQTAFHWSDPSATAHIFPPHSTLLSKSNPRREQLQTNQNCDPLHNSSVASQYFFHEFNSPSGITKSPGQHPSTSFG